MVCRDGDGQVRVHATEFRGARESCQEFIEMIRASAHCSFFRAYPATSQRWKVLPPQVGNAASSLLDSARQTLQQHGINVPSSAAPQSDTRMRETADSATRQVARATWWSFALLVLGAIIAKAAGQPVTTTTYTERTTTTGLRRPVPCDVASQLITAWVRQAVE